MLIKSLFTSSLLAARIGLILLLSPSLAFSWTYTGHVLIAQIAYDNLTPKEQVKANALAQSIFSQLPSAQQQALNTRYTNASTFAKVALLPDSWKTWKIQTLFNHYEAPIPANLVPYANSTTATWHYINRAYPSTNHCPAPSQPNITTILPLLEADLPQARTHNEAAQAMHQKEIARNQAGLLLILLTHLVADNHQPLHTFGKMTAGCQTDRGGNDVCLKVSKKGTCTKTLHSLWDSGVGYIKPKMNIALTASKLEARYPRSMFTQAELKSVSSTQWAANNVAFAPFIYTLKPGEPISATYYEQGQTLATTQMVLAGYRLAGILQQSGILEPYHQVVMP